MMKSPHFILGIINISTGIIFIVISIPLALNKIPMNSLYGFRIKKSFTSEENWYTINRYGGKQLAYWSSLLVIIGVVYFLFPVNMYQSQTAIVFFAVAPIIICTTVAIVKTIIFSKRL